MYCRLCPRACGVQRSLGFAGMCGQSEQMRIAKVMLHKWEEPCISGTNGSGAIFFTGCPLGCVYCQNSDISTGSLGKETAPEKLAEIMSQLESSGAHNINLVTGTHFIPQIIGALEIYRPDIPIVWNTSGYETCESIEALSKYIDIWLPDYKYALSECAEKYSHAPDYPETALAAIMKMRSAQPQDIFDSSGIMTHGVIIRHLVLPGNTRNSLAAVRALSTHLPGTRVSLMSQYIPAGRADEFKELSRRITRREYDKVVTAALEMGIDGYIQEISAADSCYVPDFHSDTDITV